MLHISANELQEAKHYIRLALREIDATGPESPLRIARGHVAAAGYAVTRLGSNLELATEALDQALGTLDSFDA
jgi:hypothetical protein